MKSIKLMSSNPLPVAGISLSYDPEGGLAFKEYAVRSHKVLTTLGWAVMSLSAIIVILFCLFLIWVTAKADPPRDSQRILPEYQKAEIRRRLKYHGLAGQVSVVEIRQDGSLWFERGGKWLKLK